MKSNESNVSQLIKALSQLVDAAIDKKLMQDIGILIKYNSTEEIRIALGLKPWDEFTIESIQWWLADKHTDNTQKLQYIYSKKRTGQTTKMLVEAVYASQFSRVMLVGHNGSYSSDLARMAFDMCYKLGLSNADLKIDSIHPSLWKKGDYDLKAKVFVDHYTGSK